MLRYRNTIIRCFQRARLGVILALVLFDAVANSKELGLLSPFAADSDSFVTHFTRDDLHTDLKSWAQLNAPLLLRPTDRKSPYEEKARKVLPLDALVNGANRHRISPRSLISYVTAKYTSLNVYLNSGGLNNIEKDIAELTRLKAEQTPTNFVLTDNAIEYTKAFSQYFGPLPYHMAASAFRAYPTAITLDPPIDLLQLPYLQGEQWYLYGGPHQDYNGDVVDTLPFNALDMGGPWQEYPADTSDRWLAASFDGTFHRQSSCLFSIESDDGRWVLAYAHADNLQKNWGDSVTKNEKLGIYAGTLAQAVCGADGWSSHPHLHFSLWRYNSVNQSYDPVEIDGAYFSGYQYKTTQTIAYAASCTKSYFEKERTIYCPTLPTTINPTPIPNPVVEEVIEIEDDILLLIVPLL